VARLCVSRELQAFARRADRPVVRWLRAAGADLHARTGGPGIGVIGLCMTGGFALALAVDEHVLAPVLGQPSLPVALTPAHARDLGLPDAAADVVADRCAAEGLQLLALRFRGDVLSPAARFAALRERFGDAVEVIELDDREWTRSRRALPRDERPVSLGRPHSAIGGDYLDAPPTRAAMDRVLEFLEARLRRSGA
jgi:dienelactone hydrolase